MSAYISVSGLLWSEGEEIGDQVDLVNDVLFDACDKIGIVCDLDLQPTNSIEDKLESPWPQTRTLNDLDKDFDEIGARGAEEFEWLWLAANTAIRDAAMRAGVEVCDRRIRWLMFKVALGVCYWIKAQEIAKKETGVEAND